MLILPVPIPDEEKKLAEVFVLTLLCGASEGLMEALMAFIKLFDLVTITEEILNRKLHLLCILIIFTFSSQRRTKRKKITEIFIFTLLCGPQRFYEGLKDLHKTF